MAFDRTALFLMTMAAVALLPGGTASAQPAPAAPTVPNAKTIALANCIATRNPDAITARRSASSQSSRYPDARRIASVISISTLNCDGAGQSGETSASIIEANLLAETILAKKAGPIVVPPRRMTAFARCIVDKHPAAARSFIDKAEADITADNQALRGEMAVSLGADLVTPLFPLPACSDELDKLESRISVDELYAEVLRQLPGPAAEPYAAYPIGDIGLNFSKKPAPEVRELAVCLWRNSRTRALTMSDAFFAHVMAPGDEFKAAITRGDFVACGGEPSVQLAMSDIRAVAGQLFLIRQNQLARCLIARDPDAVKTALAALETEGAKILPGASSATQRQMAASIKPLPADLTLLGQSCDIAAIAFADRNNATRGALMDEISHEMGRGSKAAAPAPQLPAKP